MRRLLKTDNRSTTFYTHLQKEVLADRLLDDMHELSHWSVRPHLSINGDPADERGIDTGTMTAVVRDGLPCVRLTTPVTADVKNKDYGRGWGLATLFRDCGGEDWSAYNRLIFKVYPELPGFNVVSLCLYLYTDDTDDVRMPNDVTREGLHFVCLKNHKWNTVEWEFPELVRRKVKGFSFQYRLQGAEPGAAQEIFLDFTDVRLQKVRADHARGWEPGDGEIAFSHSGYLPDSRKTAIGKGLKENRFAVIRCSDGTVAYSGAIREEKRDIGAFQVLDFTDLTEEGRFFLRSGSVLTRPFTISRSVWRSSVRKTLDFFYAQRCGFPVPGVHDICHTDFMCEHNGLRKVMNGGWHDAGDVSQGLNNTSEAVYAMLCLAERVKEEDPELFELALDEARWGAEWVLKGRFADGYRASWLTMDFWTQGFIGDNDDIIHKAVRMTWDNILCAGTEAKISMMFREDDPSFAERSLLAAKQDYLWALEDLAHPENARPGMEYVFIVSQGCISAILLYEATGEENYLRDAESFAEKILACQETAPQDFVIPLNGFFYVDPKHSAIVHSQHRSFEHAPLTALQMIRKVCPKDAYVDAMRLYGAYIRKVVELTAPYGMIPASIYKLSEVNDEEPRSWFSCPSAEEARKQIRNGVRLSDDAYLRRFPVWYAFRGNSGITLTQARGILACAEVLEDPELLEIVQHALEWHVGRNPFNQSLIWGEGYNCSPQYTAMSGYLTGSFPVGVETQRDEDVPYYPHAACYNYKEVWVFPATRWLSILASYPSEL